MTRGEWTNTPYRMETRGACLYGLPYDTSGRSIIVTHVAPSEEELDKNSPYPLMVKFTKMVLATIHNEKVKAREAKQEACLNSAEYWEAWCKIRALIDLEEYYMQRLHHYRDPMHQPLPASLLA